MRSQSQHTGELYHPQGQRHQQIAQLEDQEGARRGYRGSGYHVERIVDSGVNPGQSIEADRGQRHPTEGAVDSPDSESDAGDGGYRVGGKRGVGRLVEQQTYVEILEGSGAEVVHVENEHDQAGEGHRSQRDEHADLVPGPGVAVLLHEPDHDEQQGESDGHEVVANDPLGHPVHDRQRADEAVYSEK